MHESRLGALIIDCQVDDLEAAAEFWSAALGGEPDRHGDPEGRYIEIFGDIAEPRVILQRAESRARCPSILRPVISRARSRGSKSSARSWSR